MNDQLDLEKYQQYLNQNKFDRIDDNTYQKMYTHFYDSKTTKLSCMGIHQSYPQYAHLSVLQLQKILNQTHNPEKRLQLTQEITYRFLTQDILSLLYTYHHPLEENNTFCTTTPLDHHSLPDILSLFLSPQYAGLKEKEKHRIMQAIHNHLCVDSKIPPCRLLLCLSKQSVDQNSNMIYEYDIDSNTGFILLPEQSNLRKNRYLYSYIGQYGYCTMLASLLHETQHYYTSMKAPITNALEEQSAISCFHYIMMSNLNYEYSAYSYYQDPNELHSTIFAMNKMKEWIDNGTLPTNILTDIMMLENAVTCYTFFKESGHTWQTIKNTMQEYLKKENEFFSSFHPLFALYEQQRNNQYSLDEYFDILFHQYELSKSLCCTYSKKVYRFFKNYCDQNPIFYKNINKIFIVSSVHDEIKRMQKQVFRRGHYTIHTPEIDTLLYCALSALDHKQNHNATKGFDLLQQFLQERQQRTTSSTSKEDSVTRQS